MTKDDRKAIKTMCQQGGLDVMKSVIEELKKDLHTPKFEGSSAETIYELGVLNGINQGLEMLLELTESIATDV